MMIGPAPMIMIVEMSVRFGIRFSFPVAAGRLGLAARGIIAPEGRPGARAQGLKSALFGSC